MSTPYSIVFRWKKYTQNNDLACSMSCGSWIDCRRLHSNGINIFLLFICLLEYSQSDHNSVEWDRFVLIFVPNNTNGRVYVGFQWTENMNTFVMSFAFIFEA